MELYSINRQSLPLVATSFVGRDAELHDLRERLADENCRLLTLTGPGGIGKTRLALEVARRIGPDFADGVFFVPLAPLTDPALVAPAIAEIIGFEPQNKQGSLLEQLLQHLKERDILLVLDNFEHLIPAADLLSTILDYAPRLKVVVTSRETLNLSHEWVRSVAGMHYPNGVDIEEALTYSSIRLFLDRAQRVQTTIDLALELPHIIRICRLVEGMPLAIELAAGWLRTLSTELIADKLETGLDILKGRSRDRWERHQSIRTVFDHSYEMLSEEEACVFRHFSVFSGGASEQAAGEIASATLDLLASLVDKSLLRRDAQGRYEIHELLRQYGREQLEAAGEAEAVLQAHSEHYLNFLTERTNDIKGGRQIKALDEIEADFENVRHAWYYAIRVKNLEGLDSGLESVSFYTDMRGRYLEGARMLRDASEIAPEGMLYYCRFYTRLIRLLALGSYEGNLLLLDVLRTCIEIAKQENNLFELGYSHMTLGIFGCMWDGSQEFRFEENYSYRAQGVFDITSDGLLEYPFEMDSIIHQFEVSLSYFQQIEDSFFIAEMLCWAGVMRSIQTSGETGLDMLYDSLKIRRETKEMNGVAWSTCNIAEILLLLNDYDGAERYAREGVEVMRRVRSRKGIEYSGLVLFRILVLKGKLTEARQLIEQTRPHVLNAISLLHIDATLGFIIGIQDEDYQTALAYSQRVTGTDISKSQFADASELWGLVIALCGLGQYEAMRRVFPLSKEDKFTYQGSASILLICEAVAQAAEGQAERASELLGLVDSLTPGASGWVGEWALVDRLRQHLQNTLGVDRYNLLCDRGAGLDYRNEVKVVLSGSLVESADDANQALDEPLTDRER